MRHLVQWRVVQRIGPDVGEADDEASSTVHIGVVLYCSHRVQQVAFVIWDQPDFQFHSQQKTTITNLSLLGQISKYQHSHYKSRSPGLQIIVLKKQQISLIFCNWCSVALWLNRLFSFYEKMEKDISTRDGRPHGQAELSGLQLVLVVKHHGVHPGDGTVLKRQTMKMSI